MQMPVGTEGRKNLFSQGPCTQQGQRLNTTALCFQDTAGEEVHYLQQLVRRALGGPTSTRRRNGGAPADEGGDAEPRAEGEVRQEEQTSAGQNKPISLKAPTYSPLRRAPALSGNLP